MDKENMKEEGETQETPSKETSNSKSSAQIPESFQEDAHELVESCTNEQQIRYIQDCCSKKHSELMDKKSKDKKSSPKPVEYSDEDMPKDY